MKLLRMVASFGKLDREELLLQDGLTVLTAPNESGKTTWSAFLLAMFYGVDTTERNSKTNFPVKLRYKPWNGRPMEGRIDLIFQGLPITIERTTISSRAPMGEFRAYQTQTGQPLDWLCAENCGQTLLGVERSVFERSAFFRQDGLSLSPDSSLEQRLGRLVSTGDESVSYLETEKVLRNLRNRCWHNKTGLLPQAQKDLESVKALQNQIASIHSNILHLRSQKQALLEKQAYWERVSENLQAAEVQEKLAQKEQARSQWEAAQARARMLQEAAQSYPSVSTLQSLQAQLDAQQDALQTLSLEEAVSVSPPVAPACPPAFSNLSICECQQTAQQDADRLSALQQPLPPVGKGPIWAGITAAFLAVAGWFLHPAVAIACAVLACLFVGTWLSRKQRKKRDIAHRHMQEAAIQKQYQVQSSQEILSVCQSYLEQMASYEVALESYTLQRQDLQSRRQAVQQAVAQCLTQVQAFAPHAASTADCRQAIVDALQIRLESDFALRELQRAKEQYASISALVGQLTPTQTPDATVVGQHTPAEATSQLTAIDQQLSELEARLNQADGQVRALGDPLVLAAKEEQLQDKIQTLQQRFQALELALNMLNKANEQLQSRFSPQLSTLAGEFMAFLTDERYEKVLINRELELSARTAGDTVTRELRALSCGTGDQLYFAVRLAMCRLLLPPHVPIILDDALAYFDDQRAKRALQLLATEAKTRQVLLLTCQQREQDLWQAITSVSHST